jgi:uncharacterized protein (DUF488 family)
MSTGVKRPALVSIGYEGRDVDELLTQLLANKVTVLVDVRLNAVSRKPGLSKRRLAEALRTVGIGYVHHRGLGNPKDNRDGFRAGSKAAIDRFWGLLQTPEAAEALNEVRSELTEDVVALLCFEREHRSCHRGIVAEAIRKDLPALELVTV